MRDPWVYIGFSMIDQVEAVSFYSNKKLLSTQSSPKLTKEFLRWLVGFIDAEGCFMVLVKNSTVSFMLRIELHKDDAGVLYKIKEMLGVGNIQFNRSRDSVLFYVAKFEDIVGVILPIFEEFPLQTTKYLDFKSFKEAINIKLNYKKRDTLTKTDIKKINNLKASMNSLRSISDKELDILRKRINIDPSWLMGFVEGEGTFGYKHLVPYFQIGQHEKNSFVLKAIELFLLDLSKQSNSFIGVAPGVGTELFTIHYALNNRTGVYSMTVLGIDPLYKFIVPFFGSMPFLTRKSIDFYYWVISVRMHKLGYYYLPEGKKIALQISMSTNKHRLTTFKGNRVSLPSEESISKLFSRPAPFDVNKGKSHFELVREFIISKGGRKGFIVHIYDLSKEKELPGSPFSTYGAGHKVIGLRAGSRVIGRYIDTGKAYKDRYIFSSVPNNFKNE